MVGLVSDSLDSDDGAEVKGSSPVVDFTVPSISELDFSSPLFDSLPDFDTLKDYWICGSPREEMFGGSGEESFLGIEEVMDMVESESGKGTLSEAVDVSTGVTHVGEREELEEGKRSILGGVEVEGSDMIEQGDARNVMNLEHGELEADKRLSLGGLDVARSVVDGNGALEEMKDEQKIKTEINGSFSPSIEADMRKVSLDGPADSSVANQGLDVIVKTEVKSETESDSDSESESGSSESSSSEASSSDASSSSDDEKDGVVRRNADLSGVLEEGEIMDEDVEQMVAWSDDEEDVVKGPIRSKNEITELPPVPKIDVTLNPSHETCPVGVVLSIVGKQVIVEGVEKHNPLNEGSILWITERRQPLGLVDDIFGPVKNPYYSIRYNSEDEVPSDISVGTPISFVPEFVNHVLNDPSLYKKGYDASNENDEELSEELEFSDDEKEAEYRRMLKLSKRGSNDETGGKKKDRRKSKNQERNWNNTRPSPQMNSNERNPLASHTSQHPPAKETHQNQRNQFSGGGQSFPSPNAMVAPFQHMNQPAGFNMGSSGVWPNGMPIQQQQQPMFFPNAFAMNGMPWMQQNNLVRNPFMPMPMPMPRGMQFPQQFGQNQMLPSNLVVPGMQQVFMGGGGSSDPPFPPGFFSQNNFNQGSGQNMSTSMPGASLTNTSSSEQNGQQSPNTTDNTSNDQQGRADMSSARGRNPNSQWRGRSGGRSDRGCRFGRGGRGSGGRGRGRHQGN